MFLELPKNKQLVMDAVGHFYDKYDFIKKSKIIGNVTKEEKLR